jgi:PAS domain S-box-containing protein
MKPGKPPAKPEKEISMVNGQDLKEALRQSEESYHGLFNTIRQAIYIYDNEGRFIEVNDGACAMYGYTREMFIGRTPEFLAAPGLNDFSEVMEQFQKAFAGEPQQLEFWGRRNNGEIFPKDIRLYKGRYSGNDVLIGVATDITEQKRAEKALHASEEYYRAIVNTSPDSIAITNLTGTIRMVSPASVAMFALPDPAAAIGKSIFTFVVPEEEERVRQSMEVLLKTGVALGVFHGRRTDGSVFPFEVHASLMRDRAGNPWQLVMVLRDITVRKRLEETLSSALLRSQNQQQLIFAVAASPHIAAGEVEELSLMITEWAAPLLGVERAGVWLFDDTETRLACTDLFESPPGRHTSGAILLESEFRNEFAALKRANFINADDVLTDPRTAGYVERYIKPLGITSMLDAVIRSAGKNIGVICFEHVEKQHTWEPDECTFACQLADQIALTVINREQRKVQQELAKSEELFREVFNNANDAVFLHDLTPEGPGKYLLVNDIALRWLGYTRDEILTMTPRDIMPEEIRKKIIPNIMTVLAKDGSATFESMHRRKDGSIYPVEVSTHLFPLGQKTVALSIARDITQRKRSEERVQESEHRFATVFQSSPVALTLVSAAEGTFVDVNDAFVRNSGYAREDVIGITAEQLGFFPDAGEREQMTSPLRNGQCVYGREMKCRTKGGDIRTCRFSFCYILMGEKPYILSSIEDITEHKATKSAVQALVKSMVGSTGLNALKNITENVSSWLGADCVMIGEIQPDNQTVKALSMFLDGKEIADFSYTLKGTPCENVIIKGFCLYPDNVIQLFPESRILAELNVRGYVGTTLRNSAGKVFGVLCVLSRGPLRPPSSVREIMDIIAVKAAAELERTRIEHALVESRYVLEEAMDMAHIADWEFDVVTDTFTFNDRLYALYGTTAEREGDYLMPADVYVREFVHPDDVGIVNDEVKNVKNTPDPGYHSQIEYRIIRRDGSVRYIVARIGIIKDADGRTVKTYGADQDITVRKLAEQALKESEMWYRTLIDQLPDYVIVHHDGIMLYVNPAAASRLGYDAETLIGKSALLFIAPEYHAIAREAIAQRKTDMGFPPYEMKIVAADGTFHTVLVNGALIAYHGKPASLNVLTDITPLKQAEETIRSANEELEKRVIERTEALIQANEQLIAEIAARAHAEQETLRSLEEKDLLLREIHHRVKNNLQIIASLLKLQSRYITDPNVLESIKDTQSRVRAMALVHERIYRSLNIAEINLKDYLNYLTKQIYQFYNNQQQPVTITVDMEDITADIDSVVPIGLIMNELVSNSLKHAFPDGRKATISIECTLQDADMIRFMYRDNGTGMPAGFDWRATESLGLRLVNSLVDQLNGTIDLEAGEGTNFTIVLQKRSARTAR